MKPACYDTAPETSPAPPPPLTPHFCCCQSFALSQLAIACRSPEDCPRASRTNVLQRSLGALVLPHTFRLPLPAVAPALPSAFFIPAVDPEVVEVINQTLMAAIGVLAMPASSVTGAAPVPTELPWAGLVVRVVCGVVWCGVVVIGERLVADAHGLCA